MEELILKYALLNAAKYGKADPQAVLGKVLAERPELKERMGKVRELIQKVVKDVNSLPLGEIKKRAGEYAVIKPKKEGLPELPNLGKKVVMRLAPFPSGPLHIGNARMVILNDEYVKRYKGKLILFYDDTIGSEEKPILPEAYEMIKKDLEWLGVKYHEVYYKSDRLKVYYKYATELIEKGAAYVCTCPAETIRKNRKLGIACLCRERSPKENLELWLAMLNEKIKEGKAVVRIKTSMKQANPAFRDRVLFRIVERAHPRVGKKYRVWPMLEFSWAIDDHLLGITHILRGKQLKIEDEMEEFIWDKFGWPKATFIHYGMLRLKDTKAKLSKSECRKLIQARKLAGWHDPRTWSMISLRKRGIKPQAIRNFIVRMGLSEADVAMPTEILYAENRKLIDRIANRYFAVLNPVKTIVDVDVKEIEICYHPDFPERGKRKIRIAREIYVEREDFEKFKGREVGLINLFTVKLGEVSKLVSNQISYETPKIHWVSKPNLRIKVVMPDGIIRDLLAEPGVREIEEGDLVQFYRVGFCRLDDRENLIFYFTHD